ncbi:MAG TPA: ABC transporter substrate-binding protein [Aggregatilineaceae bacterium]|nr:ABC transporter substrate-binding protein [Aggregatilineaceae bacterium]
MTKLRRWVYHYRIAVLLHAILFAAVIAVWVWTRPGMPFGSQDVTWHRSQVNRDLYVGLDPEYPPFTQWTPDQIEGLEADLAREIGDRLGVKTTILIMGSDGFYDALLKGDVDMVISGLHVDPSQEEWVYYSEPYFDGGQILVSRPEEKYQEMKQLDGKTIAVEFASSGDTEARRWERRLHSLSIQRYILPAEAMQAVLDDEADAALVDTISARFFLKDQAGLVMADETVVSEGYVIAMRQASFKLCQEVERVLEDMKDDGTLEEMISRWL